MTLTNCGVRQLLRVKVSVCGVTLTRSVWKGVRLMVVSLSGSCCSLWGLEHGESIWFFRNRGEKAAAVESWAGVPVLL